MPTFLKKKMKKYKVFLKKVFTNDWWYDIIISCQPGCSQQG